MFCRHSKNVCRYSDPGGKWLYSLGVFFGGLPVVTKARLLENVFVFSILQNILTHYENYYLTHYEKYYLTYYKKYYLTYYKKIV